MKKIIIAALLAVCSMSAFAQERTFMPIDWQKIEKMVTTMPDSVKSLTARLTAPQLDKTLTMEERQMAVYGQSFLSEGSEQSLADDAWDFYGKDQYADAVASAKKALDINPFNTSALIAAAYAIHDLIESGDTTYQESECQLYYNRSMRVFNTIATTGDGSLEHPFYVSSVAEEYSFMRYYLNLWKYSSQNLVGQCDVFTLDEGSEYYSDKTISFEASRVLQLEMKMFGF